MKFEFDVRTREFRDLLLKLLQKYDSYEFSLCTENGTLIAKVITENVLLIDKIVDLKIGCED